MGTCLVVGVLLGVVALAIRSLWKGHTSGKASCGGDCSRCKGCH